MLHKGVRATYVAAGASYDTADRIATYADISTMALGGFASYKGITSRAGKTFTAYRTEYWAGKTKPVLEVLENPETGQVWKQYMELHHRFIPQRWDWAAPWLKNNRFNLQEVNSLEHALKDPYRARFAPSWAKEYYNLIWK